MKIPTRPEISPTQFPPDTAKPTIKQPEDKTQAPGSAKSSTSAVKVTLSDRARRLAESAPSTDLDEAKVERLRSAIQLGRFKIDASVVARRIVQEG